MKKNMYVVLAAITLVIAMVSGSYAATANVNVPASATVTNVCVVGGAGAISFGSLDAVTDAAGKNVSGAGTISIMCTMGAGVGITDDDGLNESAADALRLKCTGGGCNVATDYISYTIAYTTPLTGNGIASEIAGGLGFTADIAAGALDNVPAGSYGDTVTLTVTY